MSQTAADERTRRHRGVGAFLRDIAVIIVIAVVASFLIKTFFVRSFYIPSESMVQTLQVNDRILVDEITPRFTGYQRGDVVVFADPGGWLDGNIVPQQPKPALWAWVDSVLTFVGFSAGDSEDHLVKRIIGIPGDHVVCCTALGQITVNGAPIDESSYLNLPSGETRASSVPFDVTVPEDGLWVLGDNRNVSKDSRFNTSQPGRGFVPLSNVVGRVVLLTWPFNRFGPVDGHHEVFRGVPLPEIPGTQETTSSGQ